MRTALTAKLIFAVYAVFDVLGQYFPDVVDHQSHIKFDVFRNL